MFEAEEQQIEICVLKRNLEEIVQQLEAQHAAEPVLNTINEKKHREAVKTLQTVRALDTELQRLKLENFQLTAKRAQLKHQSDELFSVAEKAREEHDRLTEAIKKENQAIEDTIRKYEESMKEKAERFTNSFKYYDEEEINRETEKVNTVIAELNEQMNKKQRTVDGLRTQLEAIHPDTPDNLLEIAGKLELEMKLKSLTDMQKKLEEKLKAVKKNKFQ